MQVIDPGHSYSLFCLDDVEQRQYLTFVKREGESYPGNTGSHPGTTTQEVIRALIDRTHYVDMQVPDWRNAVIVQMLRVCIYLLELRAADRHGRKLPDYASTPERIEELSFCLKCGHIGGHVHE